MEQLTEQQAKMVIEHFAQKAAADLPAIFDWMEWDKTHWMSRMAVSVAIERQVTEQDWNDLINVQLDLQTFDRDPDGYMADHDWKGFAATREYLETQVSFYIDTAFRNSGR